MQRQWLGRAWKVLVSVALLGVLVWTQDLGGVLSLMASADFGWLAAAVAVLMIGQVITAVTWGMLLAARGLRVPSGTLIHIYFLSAFIGTWLPSSTGADVVRAYYLARHVDGYDAVGSMMVLRFIGLLGLGVFAVVGISVMPEQVPQDTLLLAWLLVLGSAGALLVGFSDGPRRWATLVLEAIRLHPLARILEKLHAALQAYASAPRALAVATVLSLAVQFLRILEIYYAALALGADLPLRYYLVLVPVTTLVTLIPIGLAGIGLREGSFVYFFSRVGMSESMAFSLGLLVFGLTLVLWAIGAVLYWRDRPAVPAAS